MSDKCVSVFAGNLRDEDELYDYTEFRLMRMLLMMMNMTGMNVFVAKILALI